MTGSNFEKYAQIIYYHIRDALSHTLLSLVENIFDLIDMEKKEREIIYPSDNVHQTIWQIFCHKDQMPRTDRKFILGYILLEGCKNREQNIKEKVAIKENIVL